MRLSQKFLVAAAIGAAASLAGCGDGDEAGTRLRIDGVDIDFDRDVYEAEAGSVTLEFRNRGSLAHNIVFRDAPGAPVSAAEDEFVPAGQVETYELELVEGEFGFFCSVPGHEEAGMVGTLVVG